MCIGLDTARPKCILELDRKDGLKPTVEVNSVHYKNLKDWQMQIKRHMNVEHEDGEQKGAEWERRGQD